MEKISIEGVELTLMPPVTTDDEWIATIVHSGLFLISSIARAYFAIRW
jgi:hypothetical protein